MAGFGLEDTLSIKSTEDFEIRCDLCLDNKHHAEAKIFCVKCQKHLCKACQDTHENQENSENHYVERRWSLSKMLIQNGGVFTENCSTHSAKKVKFFCRNHEELICQTCITASHVSCQVDFIPNVCVGVSHTTEFKETLENVQEKIKQTEAFGKKPKTLKKRFRENIVKTIKEVEEFQKKMNEKLNTLKKKMIQELKVYETTYDKEVDETVGRNNTLSAQLKSIRTSLEAFKTSEKNIQAFMTMKQAQSKLKTLNTSQRDEDLMAKSVTYRFEQNEALVGLLTSTEGLGKLVKVVEKHSPVSTRRLDSLTHDNEIPLKGISDSQYNSETCKITGCVLLSSDTLLVADAEDVKTVDVAQQSVIDIYTLPSKPFDIAVLPQGQVAVTLPCTGEILILNTAETLSLVRSVNVGRQCFGIAYSQGLLYVVCQKPNSVLVLNVHDNIQRDIPLSSALNDAFQDPVHIAVSKNKGQMYITDYRSHLVASLTLKGRVTAVYKNDELKKPNGVTVLDDGSLLVCCGKNGSIHHVPADLKTGRKMTDGIKWAKSICYDRYQRRVYVGSEVTGLISVLSW